MVTAGEVTKITIRFTMVGSKGCVLVQPRTMTI